MMNKFVIYVYYECSTVCVTDICLQGDRDKQV